MKFEITEKLGGYLIKIDEKEQFFEDERTAHIFLAQRLNKDLGFEPLDRLYKCQDYLFSIWRAARVCRHKDEALNQAVLNLEAYRSSCGKEWKIAHQKAWMEEIGYE